MSGGDRESKDNDKATDDGRRVFRELFAKLPERFEDRHAAMDRLRHAFHQEMGAALAPSFRQRVSEQPRLTSKDRIALVAVMRESLERLGLSLACPQTGRPGHYMAGQVHNRTDRGKFQFVVRSATGRGGLPTVESDELPELNVIEENATPQEAIFRWSTSGKGGGRGR